MLIFLNKSDTSRYIYSSYFIIFFILYVLDVKFMASPRAKIKNLTVTNNTLKKIILFSQQKQS